MTQLKIFQTRLSVVFLCITTSLASSVSFAQSEDKLCQLALKPEVSKMTLHREAFNMYGNYRETFSENSIKQTGEGSSCEIVSAKLPNGSKLTRPCNWNSRLTCDLQFGKEPISHSYNAGSYQFGKVAWVTNEKFAVKVKRGDAVTEEARDVAVVKFDGTWRSGGGSGGSVWTMYYDREWGLLLKAEGAHDANKWGNAITMIEIAP